jgi:hypothetical protein
MATGNNYDRLTCNIQVTRWDGSIVEFYQCVSVELDLSFDTLTDTATVTLPTDNRWIEKDVNGFNRFRMISGNDKGFFSIGDEIKIYLGYNFSNSLQFDGFITEIEPRTPLKLICQDRSWLLKHNHLLFKIDERTSIQKMLPIIVPPELGVEIHPQTYLQDITLDRMVARNISTAKLLENFREIGIISFMKDGMLCIGRSFFASQAGIFQSTEHVMVNKDKVPIKFYPPLFNRHENVIEDSLKIVNVTTEKRPKRKKEQNPLANTTYGETPYRPTHDMAFSGVAIRAMSMVDKNNSFYLTLVPDPNKPGELIIVEDHDERRSDAENERIQKELTGKLEPQGIFLENYFIRSQNEYGLNREELIAAAKSVFPKYHRAGLEGDFTTFGDDKLYDKASYSLMPATSLYYLDPHNPELNGEYLIKSVSKTWGPDGYRQKVSIPHKVSNIVNAN